MDNRKLFLNKIKEIFVDDYKSVEEARCAINDLLEKYDIDGFEYNIFCSTLLNMIENVINNTSDDKLSTINFHSELMNIFNEMLIDKLKINNIKTNENIDYINKHG